MKAKRTVLGYSSHARAAPKFDDGQLMFAQCSQRYQHRYGSDVVEHRHACVYRCTVALPVPSFLQVSKMLQGLILRRWRVHKSWWQGVTAGCVRPCPQNGKRAGFPDANGRDNDNLKRLLVNSSTSIDRSPLWARQEAVQQLSSTTVKSGRWDSCTSRRPLFLLSLCNKANAPTTGLIMAVRITMTRHKFLR